MTAAAPAPLFEARHLQLARAFFAAIAAIMITFTGDHSAAVGFAVFSGFAIATGIVYFAAVWLVFPAGERAVYVLLGIVSVLAGMVSGIPAFRTETNFFVVVIVWAVLSGVVELVWGLSARKRHAPLASDGILIGAITVGLGVVLLLVNPSYHLLYTVPQAGDFILTGIIIAVGIFGGYSAVIAVFLGIAAFSPRQQRLPRTPLPVTTEAPGRTSSAGDIT